MKKENIPDDFDPSPFKDSKNDLNHALEDIKIFQEHFSLILKKIKHLKKLMEHGHLYGMEKKQFDEIPLIFIKVHPTSLLSEIPERSIFASILKRENKDLVLGFAYDWLVSQEMIQPMILREEFIVNYWKQNFENIIS